MISLQERSRCRGALDEAAHLDELPTLAVAHGGVADALELVYALHHLLQEFGGLLRLHRHGAGLGHLVEAGQRDGQIQAVEPVPLLGGDLLADVAGVLASHDEQREDGAFGIGIEAEGAGEHVGVTLPGDVLGVAERLQHALPAALRGDGGFVEHQVEVYVEQASGVLGALEVAAHPVEAVGYA